MSIKTKNSFGGKNDEVIPAVISILLHNDLEEAVFRKFPVLEKRKADLLSAGACRVMMTGSGPTLFALFESFAARDRAAGK